jgi:hypothetical protein
MTCGNAGQTKVRSKLLQCYCRPMHDHRTWSLLLGEHADTIFAHKSAMRTLAS